MTKRLGESDRGKGTDGVMGKCDQLHTYENVIMKLSIISIIHANTVFLKYPMHFIYVKNISFNFHKDKDQQ